MRSFLSLIALVAAAAPLAAQDQDQGGSRADILNTFRDAPYRSIRSGELHSAAYLTEMRSMSFGRVIGPVAKPRVPSTDAGDMAMVGETILVTPPAGVTYQRGDTIQLAVLMDGAKGWGQKVLPTGLAKIRDSKGGQTEAVVIALYWPIRGGQVTLPMVPAPKAIDAQPVKASGPTGTFLFGREARNPRQLGSELFVDLGSAAGIHVGDFIEFQRPAGASVNGAAAKKGDLAVGQVVSVGEKSSTVRLFRISDPNIPAGTPVQRVATLSN